MGKPSFFKAAKNNVGDTIMSQRISLRTELRTEDLLLMIKWMSNEHVYRYLNEHQQITTQLKQVYDARLPVFTPLFNRNGRFFMICTGADQAIGFLRLAYCPDNTVELVIAIGEERMWGQGYGRVSLSEALKIAFLEMRRDRVIAHVYHENRRSRHLFVSRGFAPCTQGTHSTKYQLTFDAYLHPEVSEKDEIA